MLRWHYTWSFSYHVMAYCLCNWPFCPSKHPFCPPKWPFCLCEWPCCPCNLHYSMLIWHYTWPSNYHLNGPVVCESGPFVHLYIKWPFCPCKLPFCLRNLYYSILMWHFMWPSSYHVMALLSIKVALVSVITALLSC